MSAEVDYEDRIAFLIDCAARSCARARFGSPLRCWLREERARENVTFASTMTAEERAAKPLHVQMAYAGIIEVRTGILPGGPSIPYDFRALYAEVRAARKPPDHGVEDDGWSTVWPRPA